MSDAKAQYKWLTGGIEFLNAIPKNPSGKIVSGRGLPEYEHQNSDGILVEAHIKGAGSVSTKASQSEALILPPCGFISTYM